MMMAVKQSLFDDAVLKKFDAEHDTVNEDMALQTRGQFVERFPLDSLPSMKIDDYVVGHQMPSFCNFVESKTKAWASIQGATSRKFGVYFGKTKTDPQQKYRVSHQFGTEPKEGFKAVKQALLELVDLGSKDEPDFAAIELNQLSPMFKAKILSLYYPERFLAICSEEALDELAGKLGFRDGLHHSEIQNRLIEVKEANPTTRGWSYPKFMRFVYDTYIRKERNANPFRKPRKKAHPKFNFEDAQNEKNAIGKKAEAFAFKWEKQRLIGDGLSHLVEKIDDRADRPSYGYDFLSHTSAKQPRYIEVKSVARRRGQYRFFLSDNEYTISGSKEHQNDYYFYLVFFDGAGEPVSLRSELAKNLYPKAEIAPASYTVMFEIEE